MTLADVAGPAASAILAERQDRLALLGGGADLSGIEDAAAVMLMDFARSATRPRTDRLVQALLGGLRRAGIALHPSPWQQEALAILRAPDLPAAVVVLGFLSSPEDRARLQDPAARGAMVAALVAGLTLWRDGEAALRRPER